MSTIAVNEEQTKALAKVDRCENELLILVNEIVPPCRRTSLALTHLETGFMFLRKAITRIEN